jgi:Lon protease-like protein
MQRYRNLADLPAVIPVFPLAGALLLPRGALPLNIFEPRYLAMIDAAMAGSRLVGMIQPRNPADENVSPVLAEVGCAGRITSYAETDDGRYLITLTGIARFRIVEERDAAAPFRQIVADYASFSGDLRPRDPELTIARDRLMNALKPYLAVRNMQTDWQSVQEAPAEMLVNALAAICPFAPSEKQALLEAPGVPERAEMIIALIEMANASAARPAGSGHPIN